MLDETAIEILLRIYEKNAQEIIAIESQLLTAMTIGIIGGVITLITFFIGKEKYPALVRGNAVIVGALSCVVILFVLCAIELIFFNVIQTGYNNFQIEEVIAQGYLQRRGIIDNNLIFRGISTNPKFGYEHANFIKKEEADWIDLTANRVLVPKLIRIGDDFYIHKFFTLLFLCLLSGNFIGAGLVGALLQGQRKLRSYLACFIMFFIIFCVINLLLIPMFMVGFWR